MLVRKQIELSRGAMLRALCSTGLESRASMERRIAAGWGGSESVLTTLSVRTAFDLFLGERDWPAGDEIVMTGANVPDMAEIAAAHGLSIRPVDFDLHRLAPEVEEVAAAITSATRAIVFTQLFGARVDLAPYAELARRHRIDLIEDAAQAFAPNYRGHPDATASLFSFGPIKSVTALGGAVTRFADQVLADRLRQRASQHPVASGFAFRRRLMKFLALTTLGRPRCLAALDRYQRWRGRDLDDVLAGAARSFPPGDLLRSLRRQPSRPLLRLLARRLSALPRRELESRAIEGAALARDLAPHVTVPSRPGTAHGHWVFPVLCDAPQELVRQLRATGFDATQRATLAPIRPGLPRLEAGFERLVYLPFSTEHSRQDRSRLVDAVARFASSSEHPLAIDRRAR